MIILNLCAQGLLDEGAKLRIYDPKVSEQQINLDLSLDKFAWDAPGNTFKKKCALVTLRLRCSVFARCPIALLCFFCVAVCQRCVERAVQHVQEAVLSPVDCLPFGGLRSRRPMFLDGDGLGYPVSLYALSVGPLRSLLIVGCLVDIAFVESAPLPSGMCLLIRSRPKMYGCVLAVR